MMYQNTGLTAVGFCDDSVRVLQPRRVMETFQQMQASR